MRFVLVVRLIFDFGHIEQQPKTIVFFQLGEWLSNIDVTNNNIWTMGMHKNCEFKFDCCFYSRVIINLRLTDLTALLIKLLVFSDSSFSDKILNRKGQSHFSQQISFGVGQRGCVQLLMEGYAFVKNNISDTQIIWKCSKKVWFNIMLFYLYATI